MFSVMITESTRTACTNESRLHLCRQSRWLFLSPQLLYFWWRLPSQQGLCAKTKPSVSWGSVLVMIFESAATQFSMSISESTRTLCADQSRRQLWRQSRSLFLRRPLQCFRWRLPSQQGLYAGTNPDFSGVGSLVDFFWVVRYSVFGDDYRVYRDCVRKQNQVSVREAVSVMIFELVETQFSVMISESTGTVCTDEPRLQLYRQSRWLFLSRPLLCYRWRWPSQQGLCAQTNPSFSYVGSLVDYFWGVSYSVFGYHYRVKRDYARRRNQVLACEAVSVTIFESVANQFLVTISESTGTVCAYQSRRQLWRQSRSLFMSR